MRKILIRALLKIISIILNLTLKLFLIKDFSKKDRKFLQPYLIRKSNEFQRKIFKSINFPLTVKYDSSKDIFYCGYPDPIMLRTDYTNKYYKSLSSSKITNEAEIFSDLINKEKSNNIIDIGSCFGEISIFFAKNFKKSKIFSIEGSTENFKVLKHNIKINNISNIIFENSIISDNNDTHYI